MKGKELIAQVRSLNATQVLQLRSMARSGYAPAVVELLALGAVRLMEKTGGGEEAEKELETLLNNLTVQVEVG